MMLLVVIMLCTCAIIGAQTYAVQNTYSTATCTGTTSISSYQLLNNCFDSNPDSYKFTCSNNAVSFNEYSGSTTCSGSPLSSQQSTDCTAM